MISAAGLAPDHLVPLLGRLNHGEAVAFSHHDGGPLAFTVAKINRAFVVRDAEGRALTSATTFAEAWRNRPRPGTTTAIACGPAADAEAYAHEFRGRRPFEDSNGGEAVCARCGLGVMAHTLSTGP